MPAFLVAIQGPCRHAERTVYAADQPAARTLLLTGASRGIGHATVIRFSAPAGASSPARGIRFPETARGSGPEDHIQVDLADHADTTRRSPRSSSGWKAASCTRWSTTPRSRRRPKAASGSARSTPTSRPGATCSGEFLRADHAGARADRGIEGRQGLGGERHLDRGLARASVRGRGLCDLEGGARLADPRDGVRFRPRSASASIRSRRARSTPRSCRRAPRRSSSSRSRCTGSARRRGGEDHLCAVHGDERPT
jgi:hypothetical protein